MMKRRISMLLVMLANMLILAHALVPHHHHNKVFVTIVNVQDDDARDLLNYEHGHSHHHDGDSDHHDGPAHHHDGDTEDCLMSEAEAAAALKMQTDDGGGWATETDLVPLAPQLFWAAVAIYEWSFAPDDGGNKVRRRPYVASGHTDFVARAEGLHAPPVLLG